MISYMISYYTTPQVITDGTEYVKAPSSLIHIITEFAIAYYKQIIEMSDFQVNEQRAERLLREAVAGSKRVFPEDAYSQFRLKAGPQGVY